MDLRMSLFTALYFLAFLYIGVYGINLSLHYKKFQFVNLYDDSIQLFKLLNFVP